MKSEAQDIEMLERAILTEARENADQIKAEAKEKVEAIRKRGQERAEAERKAILERAQQDAERDCRGHLDFFSGIALRIQPNPGGGQDDDEYDGPDQLLHA